MKQLKSAFTFIELIVVVSVALIFLGLSIATFNNYTNQLKLKNEGRKLVDVLELAKKKTLSADLSPNPGCANFSGYRVAISNNGYSLYYGCNLTYTLIKNYTLSSTDISITFGTGNYNFTPLMNNPQFVEDTISLHSSIINKTITISISTIGIIVLDERLL